MYVVKISHRSFDKTNTKITIKLKSGEIAPSLIKNIIIENNYHRQRS